MHSSGSDTRLLIAACRKGDSKAQKRLYDTYHSTLMNICIRYSKDRGEAEQLVHDSFLKIFGRLERYSNEGSFEGWVKRVCINTCLDNYKRRKTFAGMAELTTVYAQDADEFGQHYISNEVMTKLSVDAILALVERLPDKERLVFKLHVLDGYQHQEISSMLDIKPNHSYWLLHSARRQLQSLLTLTS